MAEAKGHVLFAARAREGLATVEGKGG
jgi:hypothetical protein